MHLTPDAGQPDQERDTWAKVKKILFTVLGWGRFWLSLAICILANVGLVTGYVKLNSFVSSSLVAAVFSG